VFIEKELLRKRDFRHLIWAFTLFFLCHFSGNISWIIAGVLIDRIFLTYFVILFFFLAILHGLAWHSFALGGMVVWLLGMPKFPFSAFLFPSLLMDLIDVMNGYMNLRRMICRYAMQDIKMLADPFYGAVTITLLSSSRAITISNCPLAQNPLRVGRGMKS